MEVVAAVAEVPALMQCIALDRVDAAVLDVRLPPTYTTEGLDAAARVRREYPATAASCSRLIWKWSTPRR